MKHEPLARNNRGFTLIELLVVIGIITILTAAVLIAVNPARQFSAARDAGRRADLNGLTNAIYQYATENNGNLPTDITTTPTHLGTGAGRVDLTQELVPTYVPSMPRDPANGTDADTQYTLYRDANGRVVATAASELSPGTSITVIR